MSQYIQEDPKQGVSMIKEIFVFGSNEAGIHGAGAAKFAVKHHGAKYGQGVGPQGNSYAIPTKDRNIQTLPLEKIKEYVDEFIFYASQRPLRIFKVTAIGCGLAGYKPEQIAPMFAYAPRNCILPISFLNVTNSDHCGWAS